MCIMPEQSDELTDYLLIHWNTLQIPKSLSKFCLKPGRGVGVTAVKTMYPPLCELEWRCFGFLRFLRTLSMLLQKAVICAHTGDLASSPRSRLRAHGACRSRRKTQSANILNRKIVLCEVSLTETKRRVRCDNPASQAANGNCCLRAANQFANCGSRNKVCYK